MKHAIEGIKENLSFQKKKLETPVKVWEIEIREKIRSKIVELERAIKLLNKNKDGKE